VQLPLAKGDAEADHAIAASAEHYALPTNLDRDPPVGGTAPKSQPSLMRQALREHSAREPSNEKPDAQAWRKLRSMARLTQMLRPRAHARRRRSHLASAPGAIV
jgi:hypothetical protein